MRADETLNPEFIKPDFVYCSCSGNIQVPPLRERLGDVLFLARHFLDDYARDLRKPLMRFSREAEDLLQQQEFPGTVRMLRTMRSLSGWRIMG